MMSGPVLSEDTSHTTHALYGATTSRCAWPNRVWHRLNAIGCSKENHSSTVVHPAPVHGEDVLLVEVHLGDPGRRREYLECALLRAGQPEPLRCSRIHSSLLLQLRTHMCVLEKCYHDNFDFTLIPIKFHALPRVSQQLLCFGPSIGF